MNIYKCLSLLLTLCLLSSTTFHAQATFGTITGIVVDGSGAVVPNASIKITALENGITREVFSDATGNCEATHPNVESDLLLRRSQDSRFHL